MQCAPRANKATTVVYRADECKMFSGTRCGMSTQLQKMKASGCEGHRREVNVNADCHSGSACLMH